MAADDRRAVALIFGANGQVGHELQSALESLGTVVALGRTEVDLRDIAGVQDAVRRFRPRVIVNAAAYTAVDRAESEQGIARVVNGEAPGVMAEEAEAVGAAMVHYSTDYVFDGRKVGAYVEEDSPNPLSVYGQTKLEGERRVASGCTRALIFRTSWVYGAHGSNFPKTMLRLARERPQLRVVADQWGAPTSAALIARVTASVLGPMLGAPAGDPRWGLYHLAARGETNWCDYARRVLEAAARGGMPLQASAKDVVPISTADYPVAATRPANSRLDTSKLCRSFGEFIRLPEWTQDVDDLIGNLTLPLQPLT
jgi:dTDP-4-dehydrorhamnose reductase